MSFFSFSQNPSFANRGSGRNFETMSYRSGNSNNLRPSNINYMNLSQRMGSHMGSPEKSAFSSSFLDMRGGGQNNLKNKKVDLNNRSFSNEGFYMQSLKTNNNTINKNSNQNINSFTQNNNNSNNGNYPFNYQSRSPFRNNNDEGNNLILSADEGFQNSFAALGNKNKIRDKEARGYGNNNYGDCFDQNDQKNDNFFLGELMENPPSNKSINNVENSYKEQKNNFNSESQDLTQNLSQNVRKNAIINQNLGPSQITIKNEELQEDMLKKVNDIILKETEKVKKEWEGLICEAEFQKSLDNIQKNFVILFQKYDESYQKAFNCINKEMIILEKNILSKNNLVHDYFNKTTELIEDVSKNASQLYEGDLHTFQANKTNKKKKEKRENMVSQVMPNKTVKKGKKLDAPQKNSIN